MVCGTRSPQYINIRLLLCLPTEPVHIIICYTSLNSEIDRLLTLLALGPSLCKTLIRVEYMSNGVVNRLVLFLMLAAIFGYLRSNHLGNTNEKNGIRSSSLPCCVLRTDANLRSNILHTHR